MCTMVQQLKTLVVINSANILIIIKMMQIAKVTHWLDGSNIYGSTEEEANGLRTAGGRFNIIIFLIFVTNLIMIIRRIIKRLYEISG